MTWVNLENILMHNEKARHIGHILYDLFLGNVQNRQTMEMKVDQCLLGAGVENEGKWG